MKHIIAGNIKLMIALFAIAMIFPYCQKYKEVASAEYPDQLIYMPAANEGNYLIDAISQPTGNTPTTGAPFRFIVDLADRKFIVPLAVYRSGVNNSGAFNVDIATDADTVTHLINTGILASTEVLEPKSYSIPTSVNVMDGQEYVPFDLSIDLDFLRNHSGSEFVALAVGVSSTERDSNPNLSTTIVVIDTKIMKPVADFTSTMDGQKVDFANTSLYSQANQWDFGDGTPVSTDASPSHTYSGPGTYTVTLTATGITGEEDQTTKTSEITVP